MTTMTPCFESASDRPAILIIDDSPENIDVLKQTLKGDYVVRPAVDGELGLRIAASTPTPDLILLDVMMPGIDGFEVLRRLRTTAATRDIPVLFVTALTDTGSELLGLELGAVDYITKPFTPSVIKARVRTQLALREARRCIEGQNEALRYERELVEGTIQRMRESPEFDHRQLRCLMAPVEASNGDVVLSARTNTGGQRVMVADIAGHGLSASVAAPLLSYIFYSMAAAGQSAERTLAEINAVMCRQLPTNLFMTACLIEIDADRRSACVWNAGMPALLLLKDGIVVRRLPASRLVPLGILETLDIDGNGVRFEVAAGSRLYVYSDGAIETENEAGEPFGTARLEGFLCRMQPAMFDPAEFMAHLRKFRGNGDFSDDVGLIEIAF